MQITQPNFVPGELLVRLSPGASLEGDLVSDLDARVLDRFELAGPQLEEGGALLHLELPEGTTTEQAMGTLASDPRVRYAVPNHIYELDATESRPNDLNRELWGMEKIHAPEAWAQTTGSRNGPIIAVLDTGVDLGHPDLQANLWTNQGEIPGNGIDDDGNGAVDDVHGFNPWDDSGNIQDGHYHGTHTAGTIGAVGNNGQGVVGVNWQAQIMPIKIFNDQGRTSASNIIKGLEYANKMGARITSNSWGGTTYNEAIKDAFAHSSALHIAASGNSRKNTDLEAHYPSAYDLPNIVSVAATQPDDQRAPFSNFGATTVDLAAPGKDILSTAPGGGTRVLSGTSMACPHVSGAAGLIATAYPGATNEEIKQRLLAGVDHVDALQGVVATGGRLNVARSLELDEVAPGEPGNFQVASSDARSLILTWSAPGDDGARGTCADYDVRLSEQPIVDFEQAIRVPAPAPRSAGTREKLVVPVRPSESARTLYLAMRAHDNVGNTSAVVSAQGKISAARAAFRDQGPSSWTVEGSWSQKEGEWTAPSDQRSVLSSQPFSLKGLKNATLMFDARPDLNENAGDIVWVQASRDGGRTFQPVGRLSGSSDWQPHSVDLSAYDGREIQVQFTVMPSGGGAREGIRLRNLAVLAESVHN